MAADEIMVSAAMILVPVCAAVGGFFLLRAVRREVITLLVACLLFVVVIMAGMLASFACVWMFSYLLHGDGALAIIAAPVTGVILTVPVAIVFVVLLLTSRRNH